MIYLAAPYKHSDLRVVRERVRIASHAAAKLMLTTGKLVYSPLSHGQMLVDHAGEDMPTTEEFWRQHNFWFIERCEQMWILRVGGYSESRGIAVERDYALSLGKIVLEVDP